MIHMPMLLWQRGQVQLEARVDVAADRRGALFVLEAPSAEVVQELQACFNGSIPAGV